MKKIKKILLICLLIVIAIVLASNLYLSSGNLFFPTQIKDNKDLDFLSDMELVKAYEFDEENFEECGWTPRSNTVRRGGYWNGSVVKIENGCLNIPISYYEEGIEGSYSGSSETSPKGFYSTAIMSDEYFKYGYFEARIKMPYVLGAWGAFWMTADSLDSDTGVDGAELDIVEAHYGKTNLVSNSVHYCYPNLKSHTKYSLAPKNIFKEYLTYGLLWDETGYKFYINGNLYDTTDFGGVSNVSEYIILSVELGNKMTNNINACDVMSVDYIRVYQKK